MNVFEVKDLSFTYKLDGRSVEVLKALQFSVAPGEFIAIQGPSGSGKSTLFYILGFLLRPTSGRVLFNGVDIMDLTTDELTVLRNRKIGFIFQQFHLLSKADVLENVLLPKRYPSETYRPSKEYEARARELTKQLGLEAHLHHSPNQLSGGQQQRVAIARALMNDVDLILADEPTGNLDSKTAQQTLNLLTELNRQGKTIILITHDPEVAKHCSTVYHLRDGAFTHIDKNFVPPPQKISATQASREDWSLPQSYMLPLYQRVFRSVFPLAVENLVRNKVQSMLTLLGVIVGVGAVLAMVTLGQFTKGKILQSYENLGVNKLVFRGYRNWNLKATDKVGLNFNAFDWDKDLINLPSIFHEISLMSPVMNKSGTGATAGGFHIDDKVTAIGVTPEYLAITNRTLERGRNMTPYHVENRSPVCVVGHEIAERLFNNMDPIGQIVTITDNQRFTFPCEVIGVLAPMTSNKEWQPPNLNVLVPYTFFRTVADSWWLAQMTDVAMQIDSKYDVEDAGKKVKALFVQKYGKSGQFYIDSDSTLIAEMKKFLNIFALLLTAIALLSLVVGAFGINNMMLVSVTERLKEFGIRKALGATHFSIRMQVLIESMTLSVVAGLIGVLLGFISYEFLIFGATKFVPSLKFEWVFDPLAAIMSAVSIVAVGIASGFVPALKAEKLQVIEALRSE